MKDINDVVITQPTLEGPDATVVSSVVDLTTTDGLSIANPAFPDAPPS